VTATDKCGVKACFSFGFPTKVGSALLQILINCPAVLFEEAPFGPLLFLLYINNVVSLLAYGSRTCKLYVDDLKLHTTVRLHDNATILGVTALLCISEMKDLGVPIRNELSFTSYISHIVFQASIRTNLIKKCFVARGVSTVIRAYAVYVRPLLAKLCNMCVVTLIC